MATSPGVSRMIQETFDEIGRFKTRLAEIERERNTITPKPPIYIIFSGGTTGVGKSWYLFTFKCGLCNSVHDFVEREIVPKYTSKAYLLWVRVGSEAEWASPSNVFKKDPQIKLQKVPACWVYGTEKKLEGIEMTRGVLIKAIFGFEY